MLNLKSKLFLVSFSIFISACQSIGAFDLKTFPNINKDRGYDLHVIQVNANRVQQKCLFLNAEAENSWRYQYIMYILNDKNEVLEIFQPTNQDRDSCYSQVRAIEKILLAEAKVKVCIRDELKKNTQDPRSKDELIQFDQMGDHKITYETLTLDSVCNSKKCLSNNDVWVNTCPGFVKH